MTQSTDVFRSMTEQESRQLLQEMRDELRPLYKRILATSASTLRLRPVFLGKQPFEKRCELIRKAMALKPNAEAAGEILAAFFLERYGDEVVELLDALRLDHDDGVLRDPSPKQPAKKTLEATVKKFRAGDDAVMRGLLLKAFAAQSAIDWPALDEIVFPAEVAAAS